MTVESIAGARCPDRGAVAVELALILPLLLVLLFGIIDFGRAFHAQVTLTQAAREGARLTALCSTTSPLPCSSVISRTKAAAPGLTAMTVDPPAWCAAGASQTTDAVVTVRWTLTFSGAMGLIPGFPSTKVLTGTGHMPCQG